MAVWVYLTVAIFTILGVAYVYITKDRYQSVDSFVTARGTLNTGVAAATIFASVMGAWILFSPSEAATWGGLTAFGGYALAQALSTVVFSWIGPRFRRMLPHASSLTEYVFHRYGVVMYVLVLVVAIFYMGVFLTAELTGIGLAVNLTTGVPIWLSSLIIGGGTLIYTTYGGIRGSIFTDTIQTFIIIPLLIIGAIITVSIVGGFGAVTKTISGIDPSLLGFGHLGGWDFTGALIIGIVSVSLFNQGFWSRVYSCKDELTVRKAFLLGGVMQIPIVMIAGFFGLIAVATGVLTTPSIALFEVVMALTPLWVIIIFIILGLALVMSSADTFINAIAAVITVDLARFLPHMKQNQFRLYARLITGIVCVVAISVSTKAHSVLYLFLLADLVCAAVAFPMIYGLFSKTINGTGATISAIVGIVAGFYFFPDPMFSRGHLLTSFVVALGVSVILTIVFSKLSKTSIDFEELAVKAHDVKD